MGQAERGARHEIGAIVRPGRDTWRLSGLLDSLVVIDADLENRDSIVEAVSSWRPQWIFHLAAHGGYSWENDTQAILRANVIGTANLLDACLAAGFERFINAGSSAEYGPKDHPPPEDEPR